MAGRYLRVLYQSDGAWLEEASQHDLLRELGNRLAFPGERGAINTRQVREARAIAALREAAEELGKSPSVNEYRQLRKTTHPYWPPDGSIRDWLSGGWNEVLKRAHLEAVPDDAPITVEAEQSYSKEEALAALQECAKELGRTPTFQLLELGAHPESQEPPGTPAHFTERLRPRLWRLHPGQSCCRT